MGTMNNMAPYVITRYDPLGIIMQECPRAVELLSEYGLHCASCFANDFDTLEKGADMHNMREEDMMEMIDEINTQLEKEWREANKK